jgi:hypothetical protein
MPRVNQHLFKHRAIAGGAPAAGTLTIAAERRPK